LNVRQYLRAGALDKKIWNLVFLYGSGCPKAAAKGTPQSLSQPLNVVLMEGHKVACTNEPTRGSWAVLFNLLFIVETMGGQQPVAGTSGHSFTRPVRFPIPRMGHPIPIRFYRTGVS